MDIYKRIDELNNQKNKLISENDKIDKDIELQLQLMRQKLELQYKDQKELNDIKIKNLENIIKKYYKNIELYSKFDSNEIGKILSEIISVFEGTNYVYKIVPVYKDNKFQISKPVKIIVSEKEEQDYYLSLHVVNLINRGKLIIIDENQNMQEINFYKLEDNELKKSINLNKFPSAQEFIDTLIFYKIDKKIEKIPMDILEIFKIKFIASRTSEITANYKLDGYYNRINNGEKNISQQKNPK